MLKFIFDVTGPGNRLENVPRCVYNFATIFNNTRHDFTLYRGNSTLPTEIIGACPAYTILTFPHDKLVDNVNFVWAGSVGASERCQIFFTEENLSLVGQFRPPAISPAAIPDRLLFAGVASVATLITASQKIIIQSIYIVNTAATASTITLAHRIGGINRDILSTVSIPANTTHALGYMVLDVGNDLRITAFTGTMNVLVYGQGV